jgi:multiple sugar transport system ATP-binding protein
VALSGAEVAVAPQPGLEDGRAVVLGVRPEHLQPSPAGIPAEVAVVEPTGAETHVVLRAEGREVTAVLRERRALAPGDRLHLAMAPEAGHLFDKSTGRRLA